MTKKRNYYTGSILELLRLNREVGLLLEDVIEPTLDSINRLIDVLTGVGGQLRESSLGVISRLVNNKKQLNIRTLSVQIYDNKEKIRILQEQIKALEEQLGDGFDKEAAQEGSKVNTLLKQVDNTKAIMSKQITARDRIKQGLFALSTQNLIFKMAFSRMNEIAAQYGFKGSPVDVGDLSGPQDAESDIENEPNDAKVLESVPLDKQVQDLFARLIKDWRESVLAVEEVFFKDQKQSGVDMLLKDEYVYGELLLKNYLANILKNSNDNKIVEFLTKFGHLRLKVSVEKDEAEFENFKQDIVNSAGIDPNSEDVFRLYVVDELNTAFSARVQSLNKFIFSSVISGRDVSSLDKFLKAIPYHVLSEVADKTQNKRFSDFHLSQNILDTLNSASENLKKRFPQSDNSEQELAGYLLARKVSSKDSDPREPDVSAEEAEIVVEQPALSDEEKLQKTQAILQHAQDEEEVKAVATVVISPENSPELNQQLQQVVDAKLANIEPKFTMEEIAQIVVNHGGTVTEEDLENAHKLMPEQDVENAAKQLIKSIMQIGGYQAEDYARIMNQASGVVASLAQKKRLMPGYGEETGEYQELVGPIPSIEWSELGRKFVDVMERSGKYVEFLELVVGTKSNEIFPSLVRGQEYKDENEIASSFKVVDEFSKKVAKSLSLLNNRDFNRIFKIWSR